jgi:hypothetical protein
MPSFPLRLAAALALSLTACRAGVRPAAQPSVVSAAVADSVESSVVAPGARLHRLVNVQAPWRAFVLEVDLTCSRLRALKGSATAVGRTNTSVLLDALPAAEGAVAAVNADFFLFAPPGVPTNLHVEQGALLAGPGTKPVVAVSGRRVLIDSIAVVGNLSRGRDSMPITAWNRPSPAQAGIVDARWGVPLDSVVRRASWRLDPVAPQLLPAARAGAAAVLTGHYVIRAARVADTLVYGDTLLLHRPSTGRAHSVAIDVHDGDTVRVALGLTAGDTSVAVSNAVGGRPIVLADSIIPRDVDTEGNEAFRGLHPRSAIGVNRAGTRAFIAVIDGRQPGYSMGMTLRQVGALMQSLGATRALNLDGGGSSVLAVRTAGAEKATVVNRPSDPTERPVGNALGVIAACRR